MLKIIQVNLFVILATVAVISVLASNFSDGVQNDALRDSSYIEEKIESTSKVQPDGKLNDVSDRNRTFFIMGTLSKPALRLMSFERFKEKFHRNYSGTIETLIRNAIFMSKTVKISLHNCKYLAGKSTYCLKIGPFADYTDEEFNELNGFPASNITDSSLDEQQNDPATIDEGYDITDDANNNDRPRYKSVRVSAPKRHGGQSSDPYSFQEQDYESTYYPYYQQNPIQFPPHPSHYIDPYYQLNQPQYGYPDDQVPYVTQSLTMNNDYRDCFPPIKNQLRCAACYAFSGIGIVEYEYCKATGLVKTFSEQYWIDCGIRLKINGAKPFHGCKYGETRYLHKLALFFGVIEEQNYPYRGNEGQCPVPAKAPLEQLGEYKPNAGDVKAFRVGIRTIDEYLGDGPVIIGLHLPPNFADMGDDIHPGDNCAQSRIKHAMIVVGDGTEKGVDFWLIRNSFGPNWGADGHFKLSKNAMENCLVSGFQWQQVAFIPMDKTSSSSGKKHQSPPQESQKPEKKKKKSLWG